MDDIEHRVASVLGLVLTAVVLLGCAGRSLPGDAGVPRDSDVADGDGASDATTAHPSPPCPTGWYQYTDKYCPPPEPGQALSKCVTEGDGLCYEPCDADGDCRDPRFPTCGCLYPFNGTDYAFQPKRVCVGGDSAAICREP